MQTVEELDIVMKKIGAAQQAVNKAIQAMERTQMRKKQLDLIETELKNTQSF